LIIAVNKMDDETVNWSQERYDEIKNEIVPFLKQTGYNLNKEVTWLPLAAFSGQNIMDRVSSEVCSWWDGGSLFDILDSLQPLERLDEEHLRIPVLDKIKERGYVIIMGKVETGTISVGQTITAMPGRTSFQVALIENDEGPIKRARPGENVRVFVKASHLDEDHIYPGFVLSDVEHPCVVTDDYVAQIYVLNLLDHKSIFSAGYECVLHLHTSVQDCRAVLLIDSLDPKTGQSIEKFPKYAANKSILIVHFKVAKPVCMEKFNDFQQLGRFTLRDEGKTIAFGKVLATAPPVLRRKQKNNNE